MFLAVLVFSFHSDYSHGFRVIDESSGVYSIQRTHLPFFTDLEHRFNSDIQRELSLMTRLSVEEQPDVAAHDLKRVIAFLAIPHL
jgi:hypothetical protein